MKELRYILAVLFSSLIIISGVGISVVQYCCAGCETTQSCCTSGCSKCHNAHRASRQTCKDTGCTAVYYKVDFVKHAHESVSFVPFLTLFCEQLPLFDHSLPQVACTPRVVSWSTAICRRLASLSGALFHASHLVLFYTGQ
ncbi:hypothetical protein NIB75_09755 [Bacteroides uniformis]|nr:hypothetical protein [Bacteroides uniformis]